MGSGINLMDLASRAGNFVRQDAGAKVFDKLVQVAALPIDPSFKRRLIARLNEDTLDDGLSDDKKTGLKAGLVERLDSVLTVGNLSSALGVLLLKVHSDLSKSGKLGFVEGAFKNLALAMTFLGAPLSIYGSAIGKAQEAVLDPIELGEYKLKSAKQKGFDIFKEYKPMK